MKIRCYLIVALWLLSLAALKAQTPKIRPSAYVGLEFGQTLAATVFANVPTPHRSFFAVEPSVLIPLKKEKKYARIVVGYSDYESTQIQRNIVLDDRGFYGKAGTERVFDWIILGWAGTVHAWQSKDNFRFPGPYFGDHLQYIRNGPQFALGAEGYLSGNIAIGRQFLLRITPRANVLLLQKQGDNPNYIPGFGTTTNGAVKLGANLQISIFYRIGNRANRPFSNQ